MRRFLLLALAGILVGGCSSGEAFAFAKDDLCEWVSEDEVASFVSEAYEKSGVEWDGTAVTVPSQGSVWDMSGYYCQWEPTGGGYVIARGLASSSFGGEATEFPGTEGGDYDSLSGPVFGHPDFGDNIIVGNAAFGRYGFWLSGSDDALGIEMYLPMGVSDIDIDWAQQETMLFSLANRFLNKMGWTP